MTGIIWIERINGFKDDNYPLTITVRREIEQENLFFYVFV